MPPSVTPKTTSRPSNVLSDTTNMGSTEIESPYLLANHAAFSGFNMDLTSKSCRPSILDMINKADVDLINQAILDSGKGKKIHPSTQLAALRLLKELADASLASQQAVPPPPMKSDQIRRRS